MENNGKIETWLTEVWGEKNNYFIFFDGIILDIIIFDVANFDVVKPSQRNTAVIFFIKWKENLPLSITLKM